MNRLTVLLTMLTITGCGGNESFEPADVSLSGTWLISSQTMINATPPGTGVTSNSCIMRNVPVTLEATDTPTLWVGRMEDGGTLQCEVNGDTSEPTPYSPNLFLMVSKTGAALSIGLPDGVVVYTGELIAADRMSGTVTGELDGRVGTWTGIRN